MRNLRFEAYWALLLIALLPMGLLSCGGGINNPPPTSALAATQHPLVAQYAIRVPHAGASAWVEFGTDTNYGRQTSATAATTGTWQTVEVLVAGMRPSTTYHMRAHADWYGGSWMDQDRTFTTGSLHGLHGAMLAAPGLKVTRPNPNLTPSPGVELFSSIQTDACSVATDVCDPNLFLAFVTDLQGNIIWYYDTAKAFPFPIKPMSNGHFIVNLGRVLREIDLIGNTVREISIDQLSQSLQNNGISLSLAVFHHDMLVLPNGHWIALCATSKDFTNLPGYPGTTTVVGDALVDIDPNGQAVWAWSGFDHLDINRHLMGLPDWTHGNAVVYTPDGNLLLSMRHESWILKIDYENGTGSGNILWKLGEGGDFTLSGNDPSQWFYSQHYPNLLKANGSQMTLAIWDNGNLRINSDGSSCGPVPFTGSPCYSRATIFQVDEAARTANLLWQDLPGFFSFWGGSNEALSNGDMEFDASAPFAFSSASRVLEVTQTANPQIVWQLDIIGENAYRASRIPSLYPGVTWQ